MPIRDADEGIFQNFQYHNNDRIQPTAAEMAKLRLDLDQASADPANGEDEEGDDVEVDDEEQDEDVAANRQVERLRKGFRLSSVCWDWKLFLWVILIQCLVGT